MAGTQRGFGMAVCAVVSGLLATLGAMFPTAVATAVSAAWLPPASVSLVGDSLTAADVPRYAAELRGQGVRVAALSGVVSRALRHGWQCTVAGGQVRLFSRPLSVDCRREGLEELEYFRDTAHLGDAVVVALGTNDGLLYRATALRRSHLQEVRSIIGRRPLYLVSATTARSDFAGVLAGYNADVAAWCATDLACRVIDWAATAAARASTSYVRDGVHLQPGATAARAALVARDVVRLASARVPAGPPATVVTAADHRVVVRWAPAAMGRTQAVDRWIVETRPGGVACVAAVSARQCVISGVDNGVSVSVTVRAAWRTQLGSASRALAATPSAVPSGPTTVSLTAVTDETLVGAWAPDTDTGGFPVVSYHVRLVSLDGTDIVDVVAPASAELRIEWQHLAAGTYRLVVSSSTQVGSSASVTSPSVELAPR